jgi:multidrug efflux pump subunit AcrA (membrane-fusion protein)
MTLDAFPAATFSGTISYIAFSSVLSAGGATVFPVQVSFTNPQNIRIGLNGDVAIETTAIPNALVVPIEAIREQNAGKFVYKKTGKTYTLTRVTTGEQSDSDVVITDGLSRADEVVIKGFSQIPKNK